MLTLLALGQSNIANHCGARAASAWGRVVVPGRAAQPIADPIPGGSGTEGSVWPRLAAQPAFRAAFPDFELALIAVGGTSVADWSAGGYVGRRIPDMLATLGRQGFSPDVILWHQGERDTLLGTGRAAYQVNFLSLWSRVVAIFPSAKGLVSRCSWRDGLCSADVQTAQARLAADRPDLFPGPDTDSLDAGFRSDNTHFNERGLDAFAGLLVTALVGLPR